MVNRKQPSQGPFKALVMSIALSLLHPSASAQQHQPEQGHGHHAFPAAVARFHDVLAPLWHTAEGSERQARTCGNTTRLSDQANALQSAPIPDMVGDSTGWAEAAKRLADRVDGLDAACSAPGRDGFRQAFVEVHNAFHDLVRLVGHHH
ncbi:MAG: hypothetical protein OES09_07985 [Gammaproteobacteria bacterium]|nr:hypothetical protein [Gammaproteobacteria bacterium]